MAYKVVKDFKDLKDNDHVYKTGDSFPRFGVNVGNERIEELSTKNNKRGEVLIVAVVDDKKEETAVVEWKAPEKKKKGRRNAGTNTDGDKELLYS